MNHSDAKVGVQFYCNRRRWIITDVGTRVVVAIPVKDRWMNGPPYAQAEAVFDEDDLPVCEVVS